MPPIIGAIGLGAGEAPTPPPGPQLEFQDTFDPANNGANANMTDHVPEQSPLLSEPYYEGDVAIYEATDTFESYAGQDICHNIGAVRPRDWLGVVTDHQVSGEKILKYTLGYSTNGTGSPAGDNRKFNFFIRGNAAGGAGLAAIENSLVLVVEWTSTIYRMSIEERTNSSTTNVIAGPTTIVGFDILDILEPLTITDDGNNVTAKFDNFPEELSAASSWQAASTYSGFGASAAPNGTAHANVVCGIFEVYSIV